MYEPKRVADAPKIHSFRKLSRRAAARKGDLEGVVGIGRRNADEFEVEVEPLRSKQVEILVAIEYLIVADACLIKHIAALLCVAKLYLGVLILEGKETIF